MFIWTGFEKTVKTGAEFLDLTAAYNTIWQTVQVPTSLVRSDSELLL